MNIQHLIINNGISDQFRRIQLNDYHYLETIHIGEDCFHDVTLFEVISCSKLTSIVIESNAFKAKETSSGMITIKNNKSLQTFIAKINAFQRYSSVNFIGITIKLSPIDLPLLKSIQLVDNVFQGSSNTSCSLHLCCE